jgi:hypothetical protein
VTTALVVALLVISGLLFVPIQVGLRVGTAPTRHLNFHIRFADLPIPHLLSRWFQKAPSRRRGTGIERILSAYRTVRRWGPIATPLLGPPGRRWGRRMFRSVTVTDGAGKLVVGLDDPADTGLLFGVLSGLRTVPDLPFDIVPDFTRERFDLSGYLRIRTSLARLLMPSLLLAFEPMVWSALWRIAFSQRTPSEATP